MSRFNHITVKSTAGAWAALMTSAVMSVAYAWVQRVEGEMSLADKQELEAVDMDTQASDEPK